VAAVHRHSRGFPRLINTICENALVTGYAKQVNSITPEIIHGIADDFRLNVIKHQQAESGDSVGEVDVRKAAKTLLEMFAALQKAAPPETELRVPLEVRRREI